MGYVNSTPSQALRVAGGWIAGIGAAVVFLTFGEFAEPGVSPGAVGAVTAFAIGALALTVGTIRWRRAARADTRYFSVHPGSAILGERRLLEARLARARNAAIVVAVVFGAAFVILGSTFTCSDDRCQGILPSHMAIFALTRVIAAIGAALALILASLVRIHAMETDRWELLSSDAMRRRDDGPTPGLKQSRWE